jgi:hypothetical protein
MQSWVSGRRIAMPVHDWTRVNAGTFHDFHSSWIIHLKEALNGGLLPEGYYALSEQHAGQVITDVLTLQVGDRAPILPHDSGPVAVAEAPPRVSRKMVAGPNATFRATRRTLTIRHASNHRIIALLEVLSPANKDRTSSVNDFVEKAHSALYHGCHLLVIDLFPPGPYDPQGIHRAIWEPFEEADSLPAEDKPLTLAAYVAATLPVVYLEPVAVGDVLRDMPLFLQSDWYINVPLEATYLAAYRGFPAYWRGVLEGGEAPAPH